jgi:branched-chain amino acid transport system substrate-binding protein
MVKAGGDTWFFITADYAFGHALERDTSNFVKAQNGKVLGAVRAPPSGVRAHGGSSGRPRGAPVAGPGLSLAARRRAEHGRSQRGRLPRWPRRSEG